MTVLSAVQNATLKIGVARPTALFSGTSRESVELQVLVDDVAKMIAFDSGHDWTRLKTLATFTGDSLTPSFALPADYQRMLKKARMWSSATPWIEFTHIPDTDNWLGLQLQAAAPIVGMWTIIGDNVEIRSGGPTSYLSTGDTAQFYYLTNNIAKNAGGTPKAEFTVDTDTFRLPERVLTLGLIYRWKQTKQQDYSEELSDYENALAEAAGNDKGSNIFTVGRRTVPYGVTVAYPGVLGS